jgi:hypothetical protein
LERNIPIGIKYAHLKRNSMDSKKLNGFEVLKNFKDGVFPRPTRAITIPMEVTEI